jgi:hypothetical protein
MVSEPRKQQHPATADHRKAGGPNRLPALRLALLTVLAFTALLALPQVRANSQLAAAFWGASAALFGFLVWLWRAVVRSGRTLVYEFVPVCTTFRC